MIFQIITLNSAKLDKANKNHITSEKPRKKTSLKRVCINPLMDVCLEMLKNYLNSPT